MSKNKTPIEIPIWEKINLTISEAAAYANVGENIMYDFAHKHESKIVILNGKKMLIKRKAFEDIMSKISEI